MVVIINQTAAERYFPGVGPIGKTLQNSRDKIPLQIVARVANAKINPLSAPDFQEMYRPQMQGAVDDDAVLCARLAIRRRRDRWWRRCTRRFTQSISISPVAEMKYLETMTADSVGVQRLLTALAGEFSVGFAMLLAAIGIYGVMAYPVSHLLREMGIRMALGAAPRDIVRMVLGQGMRLVLIGIAIGFVASL